MKNLLLILFIFITFITCSTSFGSIPEQRTKDSELCDDVKKVMVLYLDAIEIALEHNDYCRAYEYACRAVFWARAVNEQCLVINKDIMSTNLRNLEEYKNDLGSTCGLNNLKEIK